MASFDGVHYPREVNSSRPEERADDFVRSAASVISKLIVSHAFCSIPNDHIDLRRSALLMARSIFREVLGRSHHVWVAPVYAGCRLCWYDTIECVHVSGLFWGRFALWPVWDSQVRLKTSDRARSSPCDTDFPNLDLADRFHTSFSFYRIFEAVLTASSARQKRYPSKLFIPRDHRPQHARHLVGQRDGGEHPRLSGKNASELGVLRRWSDLGTGNYRHRPDNEQAPDVPLPRLARPPEPRLAPA